jgi:hypothetical protein
MATIALEVPDVLARALATNEQDLGRRTLEAATAQAYAEGIISHFEVGQILGIDRWETDGFLKARKAFRTMDAEEFSKDLEHLRAIAK